MHYKSIQSIAVETPDNNKTLLINQQLTILTVTCIPLQRQLLISTHLNLDAMSRIFMTSMDIQSSVLQGEIAKRYPFGSNG